METFIRLTQLLERLFEKGLVFDFLSCAQGRKGTNTWINADCCGFRVLHFIRYFDLNADEPPIRRFGDMGSEHLTGKTQLLCQIHPSKLRDPHTVITYLEMVVGKVKAGFAFL